MLRCPHKFGNMVYIHSSLFVILAPVCSLCIMLFADMTCKVLLIAPSVMLSVWLFLRGGKNVSGVRVRAQHASLSEVKIIRIVFSVIIAQHSVTQPDIYFCVLKSTVFCFKMGGGQNLKSTDGSGWKMGPQIKQSPSNFFPHHSQTSKPESNQVITHHKLHV